MGICLLSVDLDGSSPGQRELIKAKGRRIAAGQPVLPNVHKIGVVEKLDLADGNPANVAFDRNWQGCVLAVQNHGLPHLKAMIIKPLLKTGSRWRSRQIALQRHFQGRRRDNDGPAFHEKLVDGEKLGIVDPIRRGDKENVGLFRNAPAVQIGGLDLSVLPELVFKELKTRAAAARDAELRHRRRRWRRVERHGAQRARPETLQLGFDILLQSGLVQRLRQRNLLDLVAAFQDKMEPELLRVHQACGERAKAIRLLKTLPNGAAAFIRIDDCGVEFAGASLFIVADQRLQIGP